MELWIRSQDKTTLKQVNVIDIYTPAEYTDEKYVIVSEGWELGKYATEQRAIEVLNEISKSVFNSQFRTKVNNEVIFFEMPKE